MTNKLIGSEGTLIEVGSLSIVVDDPVEFVALGTLPVYVAVVAKQVDFSIAVVQVQRCVELRQVIAYAVQVVEPAVTRTDNGGAVGAKIFMVRRCGSFSS